jgi:RNA polymerase sigma-70 factor (ECF subfamily)
MPLIADEAISTDEELIQSIASGRQEAVGPLYSRYAPTVLGMAAQALDRATAEEIVQDVFLAVWKNARSFDPARGRARPWLLQIAHYRIANELRRRRRRPQTLADPDGERLRSLPDLMPDQSEEAWESYKREALARALEKLPPPQRQALGLAYFAELSHDQIARILELPLGTAKSRIRAGLRNLRGLLAPLALLLALLAILTGVAVRLRSEQQRLAQSSRALTMLTASDSQALRLTATESAPAATHAVFRFRPGGSIAVLTFSNFPQAPAGRTYQAWALTRGHWISIGTARPDAAGRARLIAEGADFGNRPEIVRVTLEPERGSSTPTGPDIVLWRAL